MKIRYNSPVILTFSLICTGVLLATSGVEEGKPPGDFAKAFMILPVFDAGNVLDYFRLLSHTMGHSNWVHLLGNFSLILVVGPSLEEKYGSRNLLFMMAVTALMTGVLNVFFSDSALLGASGIVFMMVILSSFGSFKKGEIPLTFILVFFMYLGKEIMASFEQDNISQFGHIIGGICGGMFGFVLNKKKDQDVLQPPATESEKTLTGMPSARPGV